MTTPPTDDPLATLERLLKEAAKDWYVCEDRDNPNYNLRIASKQWPHVAKIYGYYDQSSEDERSAVNIHAQLIVHLRNLAPALLDVAKAARKREAALSVIQQADSPRVLSAAREAYEEASRETAAALRALEVKP